MDSILQQEPEHTQCVNEEVPEMSEASVAWIAKDDGSSTQETEMNQTMDSQKTIWANEEAGKKQPNQIYIGNGLLHRENGVKAKDYG